MTKYTVIDHEMIKSALKRCKKRAYARLAGMHLLEGDSLTFTLKCYCKNGEIVESLEIVND